MNSSQESLSGDSQNSSTDCDEIVEDIMKFDSFKSNFARKLSNRYHKSEEGLKEKSLINSCAKLSSKNTTLEDTLKHTLESKNVRPSNKSEEVMLTTNTGLAEQTKPLNGLKKQTPSTDLHGTEVVALHLQLDSLRWQLDQTEANRQMYIALLEEVLQFLNKVQKHLNSQSMKFEDDIKTKLPPPFYELPRSQSVFHVNKHNDYRANKQIPKQIISKSTYCVNATSADCNSMNTEHNGIKDFTWNQSKISLQDDINTSQKLSEEITRLVNLANSVLCTKVPNLACVCSCQGDKTLSASDHDYYNLNDESICGDKVSDKSDSHLDIFTSYQLSASDHNSENYNCITEKYIENTSETTNNSASPLTCGLEDEFASSQSSKDGSDIAITITTEFDASTKQENMKKENIQKDKINGNTAEDESGFSSMNSFQEIGIPIMNTPTRSQSKELIFSTNTVKFLEKDFIDTNDSWLNGCMESLERQTVKVFWV